MRHAGKRRGEIVGVRWTEEDLRDYKARKKKETTSSVTAQRAVPPSPKGEGFKEAWRQIIHDVAVAGQIPERMLEAPKEPKRPKYGNRKVQIDGMKFDSQHEADIYFGVLLPSWKGGTYKLLARQVPFDLPGGIKYIADFVTVTMDGHVTVIDAKSEATRKNRVYINKKKQMRAIWQIEITEV